MMNHESHGHDTSKEILAKRLSDAQDRIEALEDQKTKLVEALEAMLDLYGPYADMLIHRKGNRPVSEDKRVVYRAREALAKARPERVEADHG